MAKAKTKKTGKKPIKVAVLGLGRSGWDIHIARMRKDKRFIVTGVTDGLKDRREQAAAELGCETFASSKALIAGADADLIVNAMPSHLHVSLTLDIFKSGRHAIVEKPVARTVAEMKKMIRAAKAAKKKFFVHHNYRLNPDVKHLNEIIQSGLLGEVVEIRVWVQGCARRNDWQTLKKFDGGLLNNHGTHYIDAVLPMLGAPIKDVWCDMKIISDAGNTEDHVKLLLRAKNGHIADFQLSTSTPNPGEYGNPLWALVGTCGVLTCDRTTSTIKYFDPKKVKPQVVDLSPPAARRYGNDDKLPWREKTCKASSKDKRDFYDTVYETLRERAAMYVTPESVLDVLQVIETAKKSTRIQDVRP